jgi:hypothetical protein
VRSLVVGVAAALSAAALAASPAAAATSLNSCQYSYDGYWRDMEVDVSGVASGGALTGLGVSAALPDWLAQYGYNFGLLHSGRNEIPVRVWLAIRGTNTVEGVQVEAFETTAETDITTAGGTFVSATPIEYRVPSLPSLAWTPRGGPVAYLQAGSGSLPALPVGPGGRMQAVKGSLFISAALGDATLGLDCVPGSFIAQGSERVEATAEPFASLDAPSFTCVSGSSTDGVRLELVGEPSLPVAHTGVSYSFAPTVSYRLGTAYLQRLFDSDRLREGANELSLGLYASVSGQRLTGVASAVVEADAGGPPDDVVGLVRLSPWQGLPGAGSVPFASAGTLGRLAVDGATVQPYGSLYARVSIAPSGSRVSLDCISGTVTVNDAVPYSELGDQPGGDQGRFAITPYMLDPFAVAYVEPAVTPQATPTPTPTASVVPTSVPTVAPAAPVATATPVPARGVVSVRSTKLRASGRRVPVGLACAGATKCAGTLALRGVSKTARYTIAAGKRATVRLTLRAAVRRTRKVTLVVTPAGERALSRKLMLMR